MNSMELLDMPLPGIDLELEQDETMRMLSQILYTAPGDSTSGDSGSNFSDEDRFIADVESTSNAMAMNLAMKKSSMVMCLPQMAPQVVPFEPAAAISDAAAIGPLQLAPQRVPKAGAREKTESEKLARRRAQIAKSCKKHRSRKKQTVVQLRFRLKELEQTLRDLRKRRGVDENGGSTSTTASSQQSFWRNMALSQRLKANKSYKLNGELRDALQEQKKFNENLASYIQRQRKNAKIPDCLDEMWREGKLDSDPKRRSAAFYKITEQLMDQMPGALIRADLLDCGKDFIGDRLVLNDDDLPRIEIIRCMVLNDVDPENLAKLSKVFFMEKCPVSTMRKIVLEQIDPDLAYHENVFPTHLGTYTTRLIMRSYMYSDRTVIVWKSIHEDSKIPATRELGDECGWVLVEKLGHRKASMKMCSQYRDLQMNGIKFLNNVVLGSISGIINNLTQLLELAVRNPDRSKLIEAEKNLALAEKSLVELSL